jgi:hypothetical protein
MPPLECWENVAAPVAILRAAVSPAAAETLPRRDSKKAAALVATNKADEVSSAAIDTGSSLEKTYEK